jgi:hypothetical protein
MFEIARFMGHAKPSTTETVYAHLLTDDHSAAMAALGGLASPEASQRWKRDLAAGLGRWRLRSRRPSLVGYRDGDGDAEQDSGGDSSDYHLRFSRAEGFGTAVERRRDSLIFEYLVPALVLAERSAIGAAVADTRNEKKPRDHNAADA